MNREEYLTGLRIKNGKCNCSPLQVLYQIGQEVSALIEQCDEIRGESKLDSYLLENPGILMEHNQTRQSLELQVARFNEQLEALSGDQKVVYYLHKKEGRTKKISLRRAKRGLIFTPAPIITVHCAACHQQIAIAG